MLNQRVRTGVVLVERPRRLIVERTQGSLPLITTIPQRDALPWCTRSHTGQTAPTRA